MANEPQELKEYKYVVNNMETSALLTPKMAERLGAVGIDEELPHPPDGGYSNAMNQRVFSGSDMATPVQGGLATEPLRPQQMKINEQGRTQSAVVADDTTQTQTARPGGATTETTNADAGTKTRTARDK